MQTKKRVKTKNISLKEEIMESLLGLHPQKGQLYLLHLWQERSGEWNAQWTLYSKKHWRIVPILPRGKCPRPVLQLQYQSGGQSIHIRKETGRGKSRRTLQTKTKIHKSKPRVVSGKNITLPKNFGRII